MGIFQSKEILNRQRIYAHQEETFMRSPLSTPQHIYSIIIDPTSTQYTLYKPILKHLYEVIYPEDEYTLESYCSKIFIVAYTDTKSSIMG